MIGLALGVPLGLLLSYSCVCALVLDLSLTPTRQARDGDPSRDGLAAEEMAFTGAGGLRLEGYFIPGQGRRAVVVVHGLDGNCQQEEVRRACRMYHARGYDLLIYDQRGHGRSQGERLGLAFDESRDLVAAVGWLQQRGYPSGAIGLHGFSYGAATALLATPDLPQVGAVVADSAFADMRELIDAELARRTGAAGLFTPGVVWAARLLRGIDLTRIPPLRAVPRIAPRPIFFIHGAADAQIPCHHGERLKAAARGARDLLWLVPEADHMQAIIVEPDRYAAEVLAFFDANLATAPDEPASRDDALALP